MPLIDIDIAVYDYFAPARHADATRHADAITLLLPLSLTLRTRRFMS